MLTEKENNEFKRIIKELADGNVGMAQIQILGSGEPTALICEFKEDGQIIPYARVFTEEEQKELTKLMNNNMVTGTH